MPRYQFGHKLSDDCTLLPALNGQLTITGKSLRRSPRKESRITNAAIKSQDHEVLVLTATSTQARLSPSKKSPAKRSPTKVTSRPSGTKSGLLDIPILPRGLSQGSNEASSNNKSSPQHLWRPLKMDDVEGLIAPLTRVSLKLEESDDEFSDLPLKKSSKTRVKLFEASVATKNPTTESKQSSRTSPRKSKPAVNYASRFVLKEARCNDDEEDSVNEESEDEETDLSGFIVDDDAELSIYVSSDEEVQKKKKQSNESIPRRRLQQRSRLKGGNSFGNNDPESDKENSTAADLSSRFKELGLASKNKESKDVSQIEIIDLTSSPVKTHQTEPKDKPGHLDDPFNSSSVSISSKRERSETSNLFDEFDSLRLSPPRSYSPSIISRKLEDNQPIFDQKPNKTNMKSEEDLDAKFTTPPVTPPRSPSKLKSPSKLLSPTKRGDTILRSPHRQSMDAFWDLNTINEWTDQYSPKKVPVTSPRKHALDRFRVWSDSEDENDNILNDSSDSIPSPCTSPRKGNKSDSSPTKSPEKAEKKRLAEEKKAAAAKKKDFESRKEQLATDLLTELDDKICKSQIKALATNTGGVQVIWSKTLRSTAGRANWRRTITKTSGSPLKGASAATEPNVVVQHFANIELAEKVIDSEERLVNTLAHEFCHLANFMISGVRDQPHGTSFKNWASKVTKHLRATDNSIWNKVEVTTKHNYVINHKYLWVCVGREMTKAMEFLNLDEDDDGCGAEYGRHSKSIDTDKHRCGRCKGKLIQVRPKPRTASPVKKSVKASFQRRVEDEDGIVDGLEKLVEVVELDD